MPTKDPGLQILLFGPGVILAIFLVPTLNYYERNLWLFILVLFGGIVPILGGMAITWQRIWQRLFTALWYLPTAIITAFLYSILRTMFDPVRHGAGEMSAVIFLVGLVPAALVGTVLALISASLSLIARRIFKRRTDTLAENQISPDKSTTPASSIFSKRGLVALITLIILASVFVFFWVKAMGMV